MPKRAVHMRLDEALLAWVDSYARSRRSTRTSIIEAAIGEMRELTAGGVVDLPETRRADGRSAGVGRVASRDAVPPRDAPPAATRPAAGGAPAVPGVRRAREVLAEREAAQQKPLSPEAVRALKRRQTDWRRS